MRGKPQRCSMTPSNPLPRGGASPLPSRIRLSERSHSLPLERSPARGRGLGWGCGAEGGGDRLENPGPVLENVVVPKTENAPAFAAQLFVPEFVLSRERMLSAVGFDDEPGLQAGKVDDVGRDRCCRRKRHPSWPRPVRAKAPAQLRSCFGADHVPARSSTRRLA